jgi:hypothetical protein
MSGFDDPFGPEHLDPHLGDSHLGDSHLGDPHLGLPDDAMGADHDTGFHDAGYHDTADEDTGYDAEHLSYEHDPQPAEEPAGVPEEHPAELAAEHPADAEPAQLDAPDTLPHPVDASPFPPHLEVDVSPVDGQDWVDPTHLGEPEPAYAVSTESSATLLAGLREAEGADPTESDDPAIRALALYWA